jgi:hypothetical protein
MNLPPRNYAKPKRKNAPLQSAKHRAFIRRHKCVVNNPAECDEFHPIEAAHYRTAANSGMGRKPSDVYLFPACRRHHREQHNIGQRLFEMTYNVNLDGICRGLAAISPDPLIRQAVKS